MIVFPAAAQDKRGSIYDHYNRLKNERTKHHNDSDDLFAKDDNPFDVAPTAREDKFKKLKKQKRSYQRFDNGLSSQTKSSEDVLENMMSKY